MHVSVPSFGPIRPPGLAWTVDASNFSNVLSIYGGHFMHMLFAAVGYPASLNAIIRTQFSELTLSATGKSIPNATPDEMVVHGVLTNNAVFQIQIEGGKQHGSHLQIDITGFDGNLKISNDKAFSTQQDNILEGATTQQPGWGDLPIPDIYQQIPPSSLDFSVQDLAHLYAAFARDRVQGTRTTPDFSDAVVLHRIIDAIGCSSATGKFIEVTL
jgi:predicted dehydrogenase